MSHHKNFAKEIPNLKLFFSKKDKLKYLLDHDAKQGRAIHSAIEVILDDLKKHHPKDYKLMIDNFGPFLENIPTSHNKRKAHFITAEYLTSGSFFGSMGNFFRHTAG